MPEIPPLPESTILLVEVGSTAHGTGLPGGEDHDEMGVVIEPPTKVLGLSESGVRSVMQRTQPEGSRSGPGDTDRTLHSLRRFARLAAGGNPSILMCLWAPVLHGTRHGDELRALGPAFVGRHVIPRYRGYMQAQALRLLGLRGGAHGRRGGGQRPELIAAHGYDCYLADTEFLTPDGWCRYADVDETTPVGTMSKLTGTFEFQQPTARVQAMCAAAGRASTVWGPYAPCDMYQVRLPALDENTSAVSTISARQNISTVEAVGEEIVCFTVPNELLVTRRNGRVAIQGNTKFAMHAARLGFQGLELVGTGRLALPIEGEPAEWLRSVRRGEVPFGEWWDRCLDLDARLARALDDDRVPEGPQRATIEEWLVPTHLDWWSRGASG